MTNENKILLANRIIDLVNDFTPQNEKPKVMVGTLNKVYGLNGFKKAEIGTPIFEVNERYIFMLESLNGQSNYEVSFYKETLKSQINFL